MADAPQQEQQPQTAEPTPQQGQQVGMAGGAAAMQTKAEGGSPEQVETSAKDAMRKEAERQGLQVTDEQLNEFAGKVAEQLENPLVDKMLAGMDQRGVFDPPPEPVQAPPQSTEEPQPHPPAPETPQEPPRRRTFADKFLNGPGDGDA